MYELIRLSEHDYYMDCPAKVGLVKISDREVVAIDSGSDKSPAKKLLGHIEANGWKLTAVFNTHSHADHIGGNRLLQERTGCRLFAPGLEAVYSCHPELEPMTLWGGMPFRELKGKFLMAPASGTELLTEDVLPEGMSVIPLPGHSMDMAGFRTADGNVFLADCLSSEETLQKYGIGYLWDPGAFVETLEQVKMMEAGWFVPAHAPVTQDISDLCRINIDAVLDTADRILSFLTEPLTFEEILRKLFCSYGLSMNAQQYVLIGSTLRSYLSWLLSEEKITFSFADAQMLYIRTN